MPSVRDKPQRPEGTFFLQDVYAAWPPLPKDSVKRLRIVQVLPKSTPHINSPRLGIPNASPGKQVLGTVPVEADGSAHFRVPAYTPIAVQPLDEDGRAVQLMRSWFTAMPGEVLSCVGCHERQNEGPPSKYTLAAMRRASET